jgi:hypothetical protein
VAHSTWIALALMSLFLVYITARGELPQYLATVLGPYPASETGSSQGSSQGGGIGQTVSGLAGLAKQAGDLFGGQGFGQGDYGGGGDYGGSGGEQPASS